MPEYIDLYPMRLKVKDTFNMKDMVVAMTEWFKENYYIDQDETGDDNCQEVLYSHVLRSGGSFLDSWWWWRYIRYPKGTNKDTSFLRYRLHVDAHFLGDAKSMEVMTKGKKASVNKMEVEFFITPMLEMDFKDEWKRGKLTGLIADVFRKKIYKKEIDAHIEGLYVDAYRFHSMLKQWFKLESSFPEETVSQPPKGIM